MDVWLLKRRKDMVRRAQGMYLYLPDGSFVLPKPLVFDYNASRTPHT
jgi:hypothetical protein